MAGSDRSIRAFQKELEFEIDRAASGAARRRLTQTVTAAYNYIMNAWPKYTYFSGANNRISISGRPISRIEPGERPTRKGALANKFASVRSAQLAKLKKIKMEKGKNRRIFIGNAVDYAPDVGSISGGPKGRGIEIYASAHAVALAVARKK